MESQYTQEGTERELNQSQIGEEYALPHTKIDAEKAVRPGGNVDDAKSGRGEISADKDPFDPTQGYTNARGNTPTETADSIGITIHETNGIEYSEDTFGMGGIVGEHESSDTRGSDEETSADAPSASSIKSYDSIENLW